MLCLIFFSFFFKPSQSKIQLSGKNMKTTSYKSLFILLFTILFVSGCQRISPVNPPMSATVLETMLPSAVDKIPMEAKVTRIHLSEPLDEPKAELSGLTWAGDWLILLPQYPDRFENQIYRLNHQIILDAVADPSMVLAPDPVIFNSDGLENKVAGFEGFEAITTNGTDAFLTIETHSAGSKGYLVKGIWEADYSQLTLDATSLTLIPTQMNISNSSYESVLVFGARIFTIYEANGANINAHPRAEMFDQALNSASSLSFPNIEYRITDVTQPDENGEFWAINYFYPGDLSKLNPADDVLAQTYGKGMTHANSPVVERLVAFQFSEDGIVFADKAPIQLQLLPDDVARNWEGLARLDQIGFLLSTDKFPETWLAFVAYP